MIGDNLATDVLGARRRGLNSLLVLEGGVHGDLDATALSEQTACMARPDLRFAPPTLVTRASNFAMSRR